MSAPLFTDQADPVKRLIRTHAALDGMKERHPELPASLLQDANISSRQPSSRARRD